MNPSQPVSSQAEMDRAIEQISAKMDKVIAADLGMPLPTRANFDQITNSPRYRQFSPQTGTAPALTIELYSDPLLTIIVFCLRDSTCSLPLHDHVGMHGFMRVLRGQLRVTSFSWPHKSQFDEAHRDVRQMCPGDLDCQLPAFFHSTHVRTPADSTFVLNPLDANVHRVSVDPNSEGPVIFLDLLTPSYEHITRECTYFRTILPDDQRECDLQPGQKVMLQPVPEPHTFWTVAWPRSVSTSSR